MSRVRRLPARSVARLKETRDAYEVCFDEYASTTPTAVEGAMQGWMDRTIRDMPKSARILEVGSGTGRDAEYFEKYGFTVIRSDVAPPFVSELRRLGHPALLLDAVLDELPCDLDLIFANAVVCHFERNQFARFLDRCSVSLKSGGILSFSTKWSRRYLSGKQQHRLSSVRKFSQWPTDELVSFLRRRDFEVEYIQVTGGLRSENRWINVVARNSASERLFDRLDV